MPDYGEHLRLLVLFLLNLVIVFLLAALFEFRRFARPVFFSIALIILAILILARFGGPLEPTG